MSFSQKSINNKHTFITMLTQLNKKLYIEAKKTDYILPSGTIIIFSANDINNLAIIFISPDKNIQQKNIDLK
jgi:hypothetical protein